MRCGCSCWCFYIWGGRGRARSGRLPCGLCFRHGPEASLAQPSGGIGAGWKRCDGSAGAAVCGNPCGRGLRNSNSYVPVDMTLGARRAITLARVFIALAGKLVTTTDAVAVARFGRGFDRNERHGVSREKDSMGMLRREEEVRPEARASLCGRVSRANLNCSGFSGAPAGRASPGFHAIRANACPEWRGKRGRFWDQIGSRRNGEFPLWRGP